MPGNRFISSLHSPWPGDALAMSGTSITRAGDATIETGPEGVEIVNASGSVFLSHDDAAELWRALASIEAGE